MGLTLEKRPVYLREAVLEESWEQQVECDALLPDSRPDIEGILGCEMSPTVYSARMSGARLDVEGMTLLTVYYRGEDGGLQRCEYRTPFARSLEARSEIAGATAEVTAEAGYCSCRAVGARRLDIRGAIALSAKVYADREQQTVCGGEGAGLELKLESVACCRSVACASREVQINEALPFEGALPESFLRCGRSLAVTESRLVSGKALVKGELACELVWQQEDGALARRRYTIPYSTVVELPGAGEEMECFVRQRVLSFSAEAGGPDGDAHEVTLSAAILVTAECCAREEIPCATDCYSTRHPCAGHGVQAAVSELCGTLEDTVTLSESFPLPEGAAGISDIWGRIAGGRLVLVMLCRGAEGEALWREHSCELSYPLPESDAEAELDWEVLSVGQSTAGDKVEASATLGVRGMMRRRRKVSLLDDIQIDESREKENPVKPGLYIALGTQDGELWEIAKRYNTAVSRIAEENSGSGVLLIPVM